MSNPVIPDPQNVNVVNENVPINYKYHGGVLVPAATAIPASEANNIVMGRVGTRGQVYDHGNDVWLPMHGTAHGGLYVNLQMPSKGIARTKVEINSENTASGVLYTVPVTSPITQLHLVDILISGVNTSTTQNTHFRLRDGGATGPIKYTFLHSQAAVGAPEHFEQNHKYDEHPVFETNVYLQIVAGTVTIALNFHGYNVVH